MSAIRKHDVFQAIADPTRRAILVKLTERDWTVTELSGQFPISRPAISKHLRVLHEANLVHFCKNGRETRYRLQPESLQELHEWLSLFWDNKLLKLKHLLEDK